jgi:hypothetical protein
MTLHAMHAVKPLTRDERVMLVSVGAGYTAGAITMLWH